MWERAVERLAMRALKDADNFFGSYLPALNCWQFGAGQAAAVEQPVLSVLGTDSDPWFADGHQLLHTGLRRSRTASSTASPTCCRAHCWCGGVNLRARMPTTPFTDA